MIQGKQMTRLDKIEHIVGQRRPQGPPLMSKDERLEFTQKLAREILHGGDGAMGRKFVGLVGLNRLAVSNILTGFGRFGCWGEADEMQRVDDWLGERDAGAVCP